MNKFKVGDILRCYCLSGHWCGVEVEIISININYYGAYYLENGNRIYETELYFNDMDSYKLYKTSIKIALPDE